MNIIEVGSSACDSVVTALLCVQGTLFVGCANKLIKVNVLSHRRYHFALFHLTVVQK